MAFQTPMTVAEFLFGIHKKDYLLPAIQREFVWDTSQIVRLVDSLMRGYPIGSFLFWKIDSSAAQTHTFYDFVTHYHERDHPYAGKAAVPAGHGVTAILDGQQRLTALNIAFYGTHAEKKKYTAVDSPNAFPKKKLYLDLLDSPNSDGSDLQYNLRFLTEEEAKPAAGAPGRWFAVSGALALANSGPAVMDELEQRGLLTLGKKGPFDRLYKLYYALREAKPINYYLEESQDADKVVDIFVRVNSGGVTLSHSDLLLTMATNLWEHRDAREEVRGLVEELNHGGGRRFNFSRDVALKTALMGAGGDIKFKVANFTPRKMAMVESQWGGTKETLLRAAALLRTFGFESRTLTADSVIIPIAYYLRHRGLTDSYLTSSAAAEDRGRLQSWVIRSLLKRGTWGSGLDGLLTRIRQEIDDHGSDGFPIEEIETGMEALGKRLSFNPAEIDELLEMKYGGQRTFAILALLYPGLDLSKQFHQDHIFPKSLFTKKRLADAEIPASQIEKYIDAVNRLPNLQLLAEIPGIEKSAKLPGDWLAESHWSNAKRKNYLADNDLDDLPLDLASFLNFYEQRRQRMRTRLTKILGIAAPSSAPDPQGIVVYAIGAHDEASLTGSAPEEICRFVDQHFTHKDQAQRFLYRAIACHDVSARLPRDGTKERYVRLYIAGVTPTIAYVRASGTVEFSISPSKVPNSFELRPRRTSTERDYVNHHLKTDADIDAVFELLNLTSIFHGVGPLDRGSSSPPC